MTKENNFLEKEIYIAPDMEVIEIEVEQGIFAGSAPAFMPEEWD